ncbi:SDR family NAD(P)-dependent oxidoreductase [bacterium]|nr:SDR family NAD(P)-dependent oxidoreductase [bacterium]
MRKRILITGCSTGIGKETARLLVQRGMSVVATARSIETLEPLKKATTESNGSLFTTTLDVTVDASRRAAVAFTQEKLGGIDVLINNAGYGQMGPIEEVPVELIRQQFETNVFSLVAMCQLVLPMMRAQRHGRIINISSILEVVSLPMGGVYSASKYAVAGISDALRIEVEPFGIEVVLILPGPIKTEFPRTAALSTQSLWGDLEASVYRPWAAPMLARWKAKKPRSGEVSAEVCAEVVARAVEDRRPRIRYLVTKRARMLYTMRKLLPDRVLDMALRKVFNMRKDKGGQTL